MPCCRAKWKNHRNRHSARWPKAPPRQVPRRALQHKKKDRLSSGSLAFPFAPFLKRLQRLRCNPPQHPVSMGVILTCPLTMSSVGQKNSRENQPGGQGFAFLSNLPVFETFLPFHGFNGHLQTTKVNRYP